MCVCVCARARARVCVHVHLRNALATNVICSSRVSQAWTPNDSFLECCALFPGTNACDGGQGGLFNSMIAPFAFGPMTLNGFAFYQGESNVVANNASLSYNAGARFYACCFPKMISAWRNAFRQTSRNVEISANHTPTATADPIFFAFVQLSTWCNPDQSGIAPMRGQLGVPVGRAGQMAAMQLPNVAYATNADHGNGCGIHPPDKQFPGIRLGNATLSAVFGHRDRHWVSPSYLGAKVEHLNASSVQVTIALANVSAQGLHLIYPFNARKVVRGSQSTALACHELDTKANASGTCGWAYIQVDHVWLNATLTLKSRSSLTLSARLDSTVDTVEGGVVRATAYAWSPIPMMNAYDVATGLPVMPWNRTLEQDL